MRMMLEKFLKNTGSQSLSLCLSVSLSLCLSASLFLCFSVSLSLCLVVSLSSEPSQVSHTALMLARVARRPLNPDVALESGPVVVGAAKQPPFHS